MAKKRGSRVALNRSRLDHVMLAVADGVGEAMQEYGRLAQVPDAPPYGEGLIASFHWGVWVGGKKVAGDVSRAPRKLRVSREKGIVGYAGWDAPHAHLLEFGTVNMGAQPFATPARSLLIPRIPGIVGTVVRPELRR